MLLDDVDSIYQNGLSISVITYYIVTDKSVSSIL